MLSRDWVSRGLGMNLARARKLARYAAQAVRVMAGRLGSCILFSSRLMRLDVQLSFCSAWTHTRQQVKWQHASDAATAAMVVLAAAWGSVAAP